MRDEEQAIEQFKEQVLQEGPRLGLNDTFRFACHSAVECFNQCCHDVNIFLTSYDILRMKNRLEISSEDFLDRYCIIPFSKTMRYPLVLLQMEDDEAKSCPFLDEPRGCSIYEDRPWSCRMYPLGRAAPPEQEGGEEATFYFLMHEDVCRGHNEPTDWTIAEWLSHQGVGEYDEMGVFFQRLAQDERLGGDTELTERQMDMLFMVLYDIDRFRRFVFTTKFLKMFEIADEAIEKLKEDDVALMKFGFDWVRFALWKEPTLTIRDEVAVARKAHIEAAEKRKRSLSRSKNAE